jgi:subtilisin family serine protease
MDKLGIMEREYVVVVKKGVDLEEFDAELSASTGMGRIPNRSVDIANPRLGSKRMTHWMLTKEEASNLMLDPRVLSVEIPVDQRTDITIGKRAFQNASFNKPTVLNSTEVNWGLRRCIEETNIYQNGLTASPLYEYALDGTGVDIVIQDSGLQVDHPDFNDYNGNTRVKQIDWYSTSGLPGTQSINHYRDTDGHGTHCAGIAAGLTYGWAKNAHIYSQKLRGLEGTGDSGSGILIADSFDAIRLWHTNKTNGRPTIVNMSWGYFNELTGDPTGGNYRGVNWSYGVTYPNDIAVWQSTGLVIPQDGVSRFIPVRIPSVDAEIDDMIAAGIHVTIAAGNDLYKGDVSGGLDYDNTVVYGAEIYNYHRGSSPYSSDAFIVGNSDDNTQLDGTDYKDKTANSTSRGPRLDLFAPGTNIISTCSTSSIYATTDYAPNTDFKIAMINGTSMAAPQVAGVIAQHLQVNPSLTPAQIKSRITNDAKDSMFTTGLDNDYAVFGTSLLGAPNKFLFSKYGRQPVQTNGITSLKNTKIVLR